MKASGHDVKREPFQLNPVLAKEIRERVRSPRGIVVVVFFLALMATALYVTYQIAIRQSFRFGSTMFFNGPLLGRRMFEVLVLVLLGLIGLITPVIAAGSIVGERERRTLPLLQVTLLKPRSIVLGKMGASMAYTVLLVVASAPLFSIPLVLGGVTVWQVLRGFLLLLCISFLVASMGIYISSIARRQQLAIVATLLLVAMYSIGTLAIFAGESFYWRFVLGSNSPPPSIAMYFSPVPAAASAVATDSSASGLLSELMAEMQRGGGRPNNIYGSAVLVGTPLPTANAPGKLYIFLVRNVWLIHSLIAIGFSALFCLLASHRLRAPSPRFMIGKGGS